MSEFAFFAYINRMKYISRWGLMKNTEKENLTEHSLQVAVIAHALAIIRREYFKDDGRPDVDPDRVAVMGIFHDCSEISTGDLPTPVKYYNPEIKEAYKAVEYIAANNLLKKLPKEMRKHYSQLLGVDKTEDEYTKLIKAADKISAYLKCVEELKVGNLEFKKAGEANLKIIEEMDLPEVKFFMSHFVPGFKLSLDELE